MRLGRKHVIWGLTAMVLLLATGFCVNVFYMTRPKQMVASLLRLPAAPSSLRDVECESWGITDVLTTCAFGIEPADFPALLKGWRFKQTRGGGGSYSFANGPRVGPEFPVASAFAVINPPVFKHGGSIILVANKDLSRAQVDYYEE